ncbi:MAG: hypothetical protein K1X39_13770 [Thermoflexales bacterium]|nr:hypothetical protein [Thermoflexales bacterium]
MKSRSLQTLSAALIAAAVLTACGPKAAPTATPVPPTPVPPTATPVPPTATPIPPTATPRPPTPTPVPPTAVPAPSGGAIVIKPITATVKTLTSVQTAVKMDFKGKDSAGAPFSGALTMEIANDVAKKEGSLVMAGELLKLLMGQAMGNLQFDGVGMYEKGGYTYTAIQGTPPMCLRQKSDPSKPSAVSAQSIVGSVGSDNTPIYGTPAGDATINGIKTRKYTIDTAKTLEAVRKGPGNDFYKNATITDGELYVAVDGDYLVRMTMNLKGKFDALKLDGDLKLLFDVANINGTVTVTLPKSCDNPIGG